MTHDELLDAINHQIVIAPPFASGGYTRFLQALGAVVELLKDYDDGQIRVNEEFNQGVLALSNVIKEAIEKELG